MAASRCCLNCSPSTARAAPSVWALDQGKYACGPPQARAPMASVWQWELALQAASPIRVRIFARVAPAGAGVARGGALAVAAQAMHVTQAINNRKGKGRMDT